MRIAYIGCFNAFHTESDIADYLELAGHSVHKYQWEYLDKGVFVTRSISYDVIITSLPQSFPVEFWRSIKVPKVAWYFDWIQGWYSRQRDYLPRLREFDLILSTDGFENEIYEGLNRHYLPHACDPRVYKPYKAEPKFDIGFIGHCYTAYRKRLIKGLQDNFNFSWMGRNEECWGPDYAKACASAKIIIGDNCRNDIPGYWSDRLYMSLACGSFLLYPNIPGLERYFTNGEHFITYDSVEDLYSKIKYYLAVPDERAMISLAGTEQAAGFHNWGVRCEEALSLVSGIIKA